MSNLSTKIMQTLSCVFLFVLIAVNISAQGSADAELAANATEGETHATLKVRSNGYTGDTTEIKLTNMTDVGTGTEFVMRSVNENGLVFSSNSDLGSNTIPNILTLFPNGAVEVGSLSGVGNASVSVNSDGDLVRGSQAQYTHVDNLNNTSYNLTSAQGWVPIGPTVSFTKISDASIIEAELLSRVWYTGGTANGVFFRVQIIGQTATQSTVGAVSGANNIDFVVAKSYFNNLSAGNYTARVHALVFTGTATGVLLDPGGYSGSILIKENL